MSKQNWELCDTNRCNEMRMLKIMKRMRNTREVYSRHRISSNTPPPPLRLLNVWTYRCGVYSTPWNKRATRLFNFQPPPPHTHTALIPPRYHPYPHPHRLLIFRKFGLRKIYSLCSCKHSISGFKFTWAFERYFLYTEYACVCWIVAKQKKFV